MGLHTYTACRRLWTRDFRTLPTIKVILIINNFNVQRVGTPGEKINFLNILHIVLFNIFSDCNRL